MPAMAMQGFYGDRFGGIAMTSIIIMFVLSTVIVEVFMGQKQIEYIFGSKVGNRARYVYIFAVMAGVYIPLGDIVSLLDLTMAFLVVFNMFALVTMIRDIKWETDRFFEVLKRELGGEKDNSKNKVVIDDVE